MKTKLTHNLGLKILSVVMAAAIWLIVVSLDNPIKTHTFKKIPVEILNEEAITDENKVYQVLNNTDTVNVTVTAQRTVLDQLSRDNIRATADMRELSFMNTVPILVTTNRYADKIDSIESETKNLQLSIENMQKRQLPITIEVTGKPAEGYLVGTATADQSVVRLSGPESVISQVARAVASVDATDLSSDISTDVNLQLFDASGGLLEDELVTYSVDSVKVTVPILETKSIPVSFSVVGQPASGYAATGEVTAEPGQILIAGKGRVFSNLKALVVADAVDITGAMADTEFTVNVTDSLPGGITLADGSFDGNVKVTVAVAPLQVKTVHMPLANISLANIPEGYNVEINKADYPEGSLAITVKGLGEDYNAFDGSIATGVLDVAALARKTESGELAVGIQSAEVTVSLPGGIYMAAPANLSLLVVKPESVTVDEEQQEE